MPHNQERGLEGRSEARCTVLSEVPQPPPECQSVRVCGFPEPSRAFELPPFSSPPTPTQDSFPKADHALALSPKSGEMEKMSFGNVSAVSGN